MNKLMLLFASILLLFPAHASAHEYFDATGGSATVVMHISPDDDPIAGKESQIYLDVGDIDLNENTYTINVTIADETGTSTSLPTSANRHTIATRYVFPKEGEYKLHMTLSPKQNELSQLQAEQHITVSRSSIGQTASTNNGAVYLLGILLCMVILVAILLFYKRREIYAYLSRDPMNK